VDDVPVIVKPETVTLFLEIEKAFVPPLIVTPGLAANVTPAAGLMPDPVYVPALT
jgi:hypothetical protein